MCKRRRNEQRGSGHDDARAARRPLRRPSALRRLRRGRDGPHLVRHHLRKPKPHRWHPAAGLARQALRPGGDPKIAARLVRDAACWRTREDGRYEIDGFLDHNPSREEVLRQRADSAEAKARAGRAGGLKSGMVRRARAAADSASRVKPGEPDAKQLLQAEAKQPREANEALSSPDSDPLRSRSPPNPPGGERRGRTRPRPDEASIGHPASGTPASPAWRGPAWAEGVRRATGKPTTGTTEWRDHARIAEVLRAHAPALRGQAALDWVAGCAEAYARDTQARRPMAVFSVHDWEALAEHEHVAAAEDRSGDGRRGRFGPGLPRSRRRSPRIRLAERRRLAADLEQALAGAG